MKRFTFIAIVAIALIGGGVCHVQQAEQLPTGSGSTTNVSEQLPTGSGGTTNVAEQLPTGSTIILQA